MQLDSVDDALQFAIRREMSSASLYRGLASQVDAPDLRATLEELAAEEDVHRERLLGVREGDLEPLSRPLATTLLDPDSLVDVQPSPGMSVADALRWAMKAEADACSLYTGLAGAAEDSALASLLRALAREEERHRERLERAYEAHVLRSV